MGSNVASSVDIGDDDDVENSSSVIPEAIKHRDIGLLLFDKDTGKSIVSDSLRIEIVKMGSKQFQNIEGPCLPTNKRCMNKTSYSFMVSVFAVEKISFLHLLFALFEIKNSIVIGTRKWIYDMEGT